MENHIHRFKDYSLFLALTFWLEIDEIYERQARLHKESKGIDLSNHDNRLFPFAFLEKAIQDEFTIVYYIGLFQEFERGSAFIKYHTHYIKESIDYGSDIRMERCRFRQRTGYNYFWGMM